MNTNEQHTPEPVWYVLEREDAELDDEDGVEFNKIDEFSCGRTGGKPLYDQAAIDQLTKQIDDLLAALEGLAYYAQPRKTDAPILCGFSANEGDRNFIRAVAAIASVKESK